MALKARLTVTGEQGQSLGTQKSHEFGSGGGVIGRSATCDWRLPDPTNTLSARHAEIRFTGQGFTIADLSTNGVYVNVTDAPLGRGNSALLVSGDLVYIGPYVIQVEVVRVADTAPVSTVADPLPPSLPGRPVPSQRIAPSGRGDLGAPRPGARPPLDPLAALDGEDTLQESDNPFKDLGIGKRDRDRSDSGLRSEGGRPAAAPIAGGIPNFDFGPIPAAPASLPPSAPFAPAPPPVGQMPRTTDNFAEVPPSIPPAVPAPVPSPAKPLDAAVIPPDFLDELSALIPRLAEGAAERTPPLPPPVQAATPQPPRFMPPPP
ncbi:MAG: FHA domain-containing protein, partial [Pseudomonadota bacterium]